MQAMDSLFFARSGFRVHASDFSSTGLTQLRQAVSAAGVAESMTGEVRDVCRPLPLADGSVDAVFAHMLLCMTLSTEEILGVAVEAGRLPCPGVAFVRTVRCTGEVHYGQGFAHGDGIFAHGGSPCTSSPGTRGVRGRGMEARRGPPPLCGRRAAAPPVTHHADETVVTHTPRVRRPLKAVRRHV